jgi:hypothetical protein
MQNQPLIVCPLQNITTQVSLRKVTETKTTETQTHNDLRFSEIPTETWPFLSVTPNWSINTTIYVTCALTVLWRRITETVTIITDAATELTKLASNHQQQQDRFQCYSREIAVTVSYHITPSARILTTPLGQWKCVLLDWWHTLSKCDLCDSACLTGFHIHWLQIGRQDSVVRLWADKPGAHSASYSMGLGGSLPEDKAAEAWSWQFTSIQRRG